jgi:3-phenylpropionate/trans-cinnamate dioxygenase ferredoxin reductase component
MQRVVIIGAGQAGGWAAKTLRDEGFQGEVVLLGEEAHPPHERPPLSKDVLIGLKPPESTFLWPGGLAVEFRPGTRAAAIDRAARRVALADGSSLDCDKLFRATGARVRRLDRPGARYLRTIEDAMALRAAFQRGGKVLVIGGGWIGLETAAAARKLGCDVTLVECAARLCARVVPPVLSDYLKHLHERHGVEIRLGAEAAPEAATVVVGIGVVPNVELAQAAGLEIANGIAVDAFGRTSDRDIYAAGDVASRDGLRLESWANAQNQAISAAKSLLGREARYDEVPWFWSDQYEVNLQLVGLPEAGHEIVCRGRMEDDRFSLFFLAEGRVAAAAAVNNAREVRIAKRLIELGKEVEAAALADASRPLQSLLRSN